MGFDLLFCWNEKAPVSRFSCCLTLRCPVNLKWLTFVADNLKIMNSKTVTKKTKLMLNPQAKVKPTNLYWKKSLTPEFILNFDVRLNWAQGPLVWFWSWEFQLDIVRSLFRSLPIRIWEQKKMWGFGPHQWDFYYLQTKYLPLCIYVLGCLWQIKYQAVGL